MTQPSSSEPSLNGESLNPDTVEENHVTDEGDSRKYFTQIPNILFSLGLSPYALTLYVYFKKVAGERGACWQKTSTIAKATGMSGGMVTKAKAELSRLRQELGDEPQGKAKPLIVITERVNKHGGKPGHIIKLTDIWPANIRSAKPISKDAEAISPHEIDRSQGEIAISPHEIKKNPSEEKPTEEKPHTQHLRAGGAPVGGVGGCSKFSLKQRLDWARWRAVQPNSNIRDPDAVAMARADGQADELIEEFLTRTPEQIEEARASPIAHELTFGEVAQQVFSRKGRGEDPARIISEMAVPEDWKQRLIEKFVKQSNRPEVEDARQMQEAKFSQAAATA
jgi:hypothetical protein